MARPGSCGLTRDEALKLAWQEILAAAESIWEDALDEAGYYSKEDWNQIDTAVWDILRHPTEFTAWIE